MFMIVPDSYIKVIITHKERRVFKWKTSVKHKTSAPVYNEIFIYEGAEDMKMAIDVDSIMISFYIIDFDHLMPNDKIGVVNIGKQASSELGRKHWSEVLQSPQQRISFWHPIQLQVQPRVLTAMASDIVPPSVPHISSRNISPNLN